MDAPRASGERDSDPIMYTAGSHFGRGASGVPSMRGRRLACVAVACVSRFLLRKIYVPKGPVERPRCNCVAFLFFLALFFFSLDV